MTINRIISKSAEFTKLLTFLNIPPKNKQGRFCIASGTTIDTQKIILNLLEKHSSKSIIYSTLFNYNINSFLESINILSNIKFTKLKNLLENNNFKRSEKVLNKGEYSIRGDIIVFWPSVYDHPIRASFFGEKCESCELIDEIYKNKIETIKEVTLGDELLLEDKIEKQSIRISSVKFPINRNFLLFGRRSEKHHKARFLFKDLNFSFQYPSLFFKRLDILQKEVAQRAKNNWFIKVSTIHKEQLPNSLLKYVTAPKETNFKSGFENKKSRIAVYTDREIFGTIFIASEKAKSNKHVNRYLAQFEGEIEIGNYIVHEDYGIAVYKGIKQRNILGKLTDYLILEYAENDKLSVPINQVYKLTKYIGPDHIHPKITRLGKTNWKSIKNKVKQSVVLLAKELLIHYAKSEITKGFCLKKHEWEDKFACEFEFEETDDQKRAITEILTELENDKPANRLLVGDVGFGKTEVAIRAAFRTVTNNKQVAVLCPTTILVSQHYSVFKHRMRNYPIEIATLSRFGTKAENLKVVDRLKDGNIDIVIGTHRLLSNDIKFKDLGLLIIDEEQKFGVAQKEKIKKLAYGCNELSMSATPIPRTLSMALSNIRDISIITTPPPGRKSIKTRVEYLNWNKVAKVILHEVKRNGQVYFLHNEVRTIDSIKSKLSQLLPDVNFEVSHGQMHPATLDKFMRDFYKHKFDCLICTTIIENGIDIKNVNTIIINKAQNFGLSQLYQLRGRVGRSKRQAYCYLFYTKKNIFDNLKQLKLSKKVPLDKSKARFEAILESQNLGSGFKIASRDLEIRGAGNLLGREQHGSISAIGLGLYTQLLSDEIEKLRLSRKTQLSE